MIKSNPPQYTGKPLSPPRLSRNCSLRIELPHVDCVNRILSLLLTMGRLALLSVPCGERTVGQIQKDIIFLSSATVVSGLPTDPILAPRLNLKWQLRPNWVSRLNVGRGYRRIHLFTEVHAALDGSRNIDGIGRTQGLAADDNGMTQTGLTWTQGGTWMRAEILEASASREIEFAPRWKGNAEMGWKGEHWQWDFQGQTVGPMRLPEPYQHRAQAEWGGIDLA